jgi:hypothetical protein
VSIGSVVAAGTVLALVESMKLHHDVVAPSPGVVDAIEWRWGTRCNPGRRACSGSAPPTARSRRLERRPDRAGAPRVDRPDLAEVVHRHRIGLDEARPAAVERRRSSGRRRTARENIADLVDPGSFVEYGPLVIAAQAKSRSHDDLVANTPADGMVGGIGTDQR